MVYQNKQHKIGGMDNDMIEYYQIIYWHKKKSDKDKNKRINKAAPTLLTDLGYSVDGNVRAFDVWDYENGSKIELTAKERGLPNPPFIAVFLSPKHPSNKSQDVDSSSLISIVNSPTTEKIDNIINILDSEGENLDLEGEEIKEITEISKGFLPEWLPFGGDNGFINLDTLGIPKNVQKFVWAGVTAFGAFNVATREQTASKLGFGALTALGAYQFYQTFDGEAEETDFEEVE